MATVITTRRRELGRSRLDPERTLKSSGARKARIPHLRNGNGRNEWPDLMLDRDRNDRGAIGLQCLRESRLNLLSGSRFDSSTAESLCCGDNVKRGKIECRYVGRILQYCEFLEDGIFAVARYDVDYFQVVLRG